MKLFSRWIRSEEKKLFIIIITLFLGLLLSLTTLPFGYYAPEWLLLINIYWAIALPSNNKLFLAFLSGFLVDIVFAQVLGVTSLLYVVFIYIILRLYNSMRYMTVTQQMVVILFFLFIKQHIFIWINYIIGVSSLYSSLLVSILTTAILWPIIFFLLRYIRRKFQLSEN